MISALFHGVTVAWRRLERLLLLLVLVVVEELGYARILPHTRQTVSGSNVRKAGLLQGSHGRRCVDGVDLPAHVEAGWRAAVAVVITL